MGNDDGDHEDFDDEDGVDEGHTWSMMMVMVKMAKRLLWGRLLIFVAMMTATMMDDGDDDDHEDG